MKVAITSQGEELGSPVDARFGRAATFLIVDTEGGSCTPKSNKQSLEAAQGAGVQAAQAVASEGVQAVITGHCGPKAFRVLDAAGIKVYAGADGMTAQEAVEAFKAGKLQEAEKADVSSHWM